MIRSKQSHCSWCMSQDHSVSLLSLHFSVYLHEVLATSLCQARHAHWCQHWSWTVINCLKSRFHCSLKKTAQHSLSIINIRSCNNNNLQWQLQHTVTCIKNHIRTTTCVWDNHICVFLCAATCTHARTHTSACALLRGLSQCQPHWWVIHKGRLHGGTEVGMAQCGQKRTRGEGVDFYCIFADILSGWPQVWVKKIQGLFKDIQVRFQDLFQRRFTAVWAY